MLLQAVEPTVIISKAFEYGVLLGVAALIITGLLWLNNNQRKELKTERDAKFKIASEALTLVKVVETQLNDNKSSHIKVLENTSALSTEMQLIKQLLNQTLEANKK